jgi:hypothetical protein
MDKMASYQTVYSSFQRLIAKWESSHPYNFVCIVNLASAVDQDRLREAAVKTLREFGLGSLGDSKGFDRPLEDLLVVADLERHALDELNAAVPAAIRLAVESDEMVAGVGFSRVAITYRHIFFDGTNSSIFLRRMLLRASGASLPPLVPGEPVRGRGWLRTVGMAEWPALVGRLALDLLRMRRVHARGDGRESPTLSGVFIEHDAGLLRRLRREGDRIGATINDVLVARIVRAIWKIDPPEQMRRRDVAVSMAVSLRSGIEPLLPGVCVALQPVL